MIQIQVAAIPNQTLSVTLAGQNAQIAVRQNGENMYFDLKQDDNPIVLTRICRDRQRLLIDARYRGFIGDFAWVDIASTSQPNYLGIGTRFFLIYLEAGE